MAHTVLQLLKRYGTDAPLINSMVKPESDEFRTLACYLSGEPDSTNNMERVAADTHYCRLPKRQLSWTNLTTCRKVAELIDKEAVDLVVCQFRRTIPIGVVAALLSARKPRVVGVLHGIVGGKVGYGRKLVNYFSYKRLARLVSVSRSGIADILRLNVGLDPEKVTAIPNGLVCAPFLGGSQVGRETIFPEYKNDEFVFAMVGRLAPVKNHITALHAFAKLVDDFPQSRMAIVGTGPAEEQLKSVVCDLNLGSYVKFMGYRRDIPDILKTIDCYLMPSLREGFPMALMEAMVSALPVITSRVGGMLELVPDENYGMLVEPRSVESVSVAMKRVLQNHPEKNRELGENAKARILAHFTAEKMADAYQDLYRDVLKAQ